MDGSGFPRSKGVSAAQATLESEAKASSRPVLGTSSICRAQSVTSTIFSTSGSSSDQCSSGRSSSVLLAAGGLASNLLDAQDASTSSSCIGNRHAAAPDPGSMGDPDTTAGATQEESSAQYVAARLQRAFESMLAEYTRTSCCSSCRCADDANKMRQVLQDFKKEFSKSHWIAALTVLSQMLPAVAAKLLDPAAGHSPVAAQDVLQMLTEHIVGAITSNPRSAADRQSALKVALAASKPGGLCSQLCSQLCQLRSQPRDVQDSNRGAMQPVQQYSMQSHQQPGDLDAHPAAPPAGSGPEQCPGPLLPASGSSLPKQLALTHHQLPQLLLVSQWTAALCRIWPSSIPDAAALHNLLCSSLAAAAELLTQLPYMQTDQQGVGAATAVLREQLSFTSSSSSSSTVESTVQAASIAEPAVAQKVQRSAEVQDAGLLGWPSHSNMAAPVTVAVLEAAALVLEPLGLILLQQQEADMQRTQPPCMSGPAKSLCAELHCLFVEPSGGLACLLQALLAVCLDQLVLHAERKQQASTHLGSDGSSLQLCPATFSSSSASIGTAAGRGSSGSSARRAPRSVAEVADGYLLQHADNMQAKQPAAPSRARVSAWRAVCESQWAAISLAITLQEAATVLASIQPSAAAASHPGGDRSPGMAAAASVWTLQQCGPLASRFGCSGHDECSPLVGTHGSASTGTSAESFSTSSSSSSSSTSCRASTGAASGLFAALHSEPALSLARCTDNAAALSALCMHLTESGQDAAASGSAINDCRMANTLLSTASALISLQGAAALPTVSAAFAAASALVAATVFTKNPSVVVATGAAGLEDWQLCLSLAADLTTSVLQLDVVFSLPSYVEAIRQCVKLLLVLPGVSQKFAQHTGTAMLPMQLQIVASTLQLLEAVLRSQAAGIKRCLPDEQGMQLLGVSLRDEISANFGSHMSSACVALTSAMDLFPRAEESDQLAQVVESLQGQQLLQSCTSLLLTSSSIMLSSSLSARPSDLGLSVYLLQLLQRSESVAAGGTYPGMSQALAAGLSLVGRCLVALSSALTPPDDSSAFEDSGPPTPSPASGGASSSMQGSHSHNRQQTHKRLPRPSGNSHAWREQRLRHIDAWLSACSGHRSVDAPALLLKEGPSGQASTLQQAMQDLLHCVTSVNQTLQQRAAAAAATAAAGDRVAHGCQASRHDSSGSTSASPTRDNSQEGSADAQRSSPDQQQQHRSGLKPADWLLGSIDSAQQACSALLGGMRAVLAPQLIGRVGGRERRQATAAAGEIASLFLAAGEALCAAAPCSACCNNPRCSSLDGVSASFALVRGKDCVCGGCLGLKAGGLAAMPSHGVVVAARYCSRACQAAHRQQHQKLCSKLAQAAAAAAASCHGDS